jgi:hypothetical protein
MGRSAEGITCTEPEIILCSTAPRSSAYRSKDRDLTSAITTQDRVPESAVGVWQMNYPDLKAVHTYGDDKKVRPATSTANVAVSGSTFNYLFPAHSLTILRVKVR